MSKSKTIETFNRLEVLATTDGNVVICVHENDTDETSLSLTKDNVKWLILALKQAKKLAFE